MYSKNETDRVNRKKTIEILFLQNIKKPLKRYDLKFKSIKTTKTERELIEVNHGFNEKILKNVKHF